MAGRPPHTNDFGSRWCLARTYWPPLLAAAGCGLNLVLGFGLKITGIMPLAQLSFRRTPGAVDHRPALDRWPFGNLAGPAQHVWIRWGIEKLGRFVHLVQNDAAIPRPDRDVGNRVLIAADVFVLGQLPFNTSSWRLTSMLNRSMQYLIFSGA